MDWDNSCALPCRVLTKECFSSLNITIRMRSSFTSLRHGLHAPTFQGEAPKIDWDAYLLSLAASAQTTESTGLSSSVFQLR